jgi:hypothetical protein
MEREAHEEERTTEIVGRIGKPMAPSFEHDSIIEKKKREMPSQTLRIVVLSVVISMIAVYVVLMLVPGRILTTSEISVSEELLSTMGTPYAYSTRSNATFDKLFELLAAARNERILQLRSYNQMPSYIANASHMEIKEVLSKDVRLMSSMYKQLKESTNRQCIGMHHFIHHHNITYNFVMVVDKLRRAPYWYELMRNHFHYTVNKLFANGVRFIDENYMQEHPIHREVLDTEMDIVDWYMPMFNVRIIGRSPHSFFQSKESSILCSVGNRKAVDTRRRHRVIWIQYEQPIPAMNDPSHIDVVTVERMVTDGVSVCLQKTIEEFDQIREFGHVKCD